MGTIASQITSLTIIYSTVYSDADQRKHQSSASLAFVRGIHRRPLNSPHKWPVTRKIFPFDDVIMWAPASQLFTQPFIQTQIKENTKAGEFPAQMASYAENVSIWWRHHVYVRFCWILYCFVYRYLAMLLSILSVYISEISGVDASKLFKRSINWGRSLYFQSNFSKFGWRGHRCSQRKSGNTVY